MSLNLFVDKNDTFDIEIYVFNNESEELTATADVKEIPPDTKPETLKFTFRRASYKDTIDITSSSVSANFSSDLTSDFRIDPTKWQDVVLRKLLVSWNLMDSEGKPKPLTQDNINQLNPSIARVVSAEATIKIKM